MFHPFFASLRAQCERDLRFKSLVHYLLNNIFFCLLLKQLAFILITGRNEVVAKVIFLHLSVIHSVHRGGSASVHAGIPPPPGPGRPPRTRQTPPGTRQTPPGPGRHPPGTRQTPPPATSRLQHTVYERPVRILLECILVLVHHLGLVLSCYVVS